MAENKREFSKRHLWAELDETNRIASIGLTDFLTEQLAEIVSIDIPMEDDEIDVDSIFIHLHLTNRIHHLRSPLTGRVVEINNDVMNNCSLIHLDPNKYWILKMEYDNDEEIDLLMDDRQYAEYVDKL